MNIPRTIALTLFVLFISTVSMAQSGAQLNHDPATVKFVTSDIDNFCINEHLKIYGRTHDAEIWRDFEANMYKPVSQTGFITPPLPRTGPPTSDITLAI